MIKYIFNCNYVLAGLFIIFSRNNSNAQGTWYNLDGGLGCNSSTCQYWQIAYAICPDTVNNLLYVGGEFNLAGNINVGGLAQWDGNNWANLPNNDFTYEVDALITYHSYLYIADEATGVWEFDGSNWTQLPTLNGVVTCFCIYNDTLYAGGDFINGSNTELNCIAKWSGTSTTDTITAIAGTSGTIGVLINNGVCADTTLAVTVDSNVLTITPQSPYLCPGQSIILSIPIGGTGYTWSPASTLSASTGDTVVATPTITTIYTATGTGTGGCPPTGTDTVKVSPIPVITIQPPTPTVCSGQGITLTASGATTYSWSPATGLNDTTGSSVMATDTSTTIYTIIGATNGCTDTIPVMVTVSPTQVITTTPDSPTICLGQSITLSILTPYLNYVWSPASSLSESTGDSVIATPLVATTYTITGTDSSGCTATGFNMVYVSTPPDTPVISQKGDTLISSAKQGNQWVRNDTTLQGATNQTYIITIPGWYAIVTANPANGCNSTSDSGYYTATGVEQLSVNSNELSVYPNPTGGEINVNISSSAMDVGAWDLQVMDVLGITVYSKQSLNYNNEIDLSNLPDGVYFISVINKMGRVVFPIVRQN